MTIIQTQQKKRTALTSKMKEAMRKKDNRMVEGIFRCFETRGGSVTFSFKKHAGDEVVQYTMVDGETYTIPIMVAKHLTHNCCYSQHAYELDANGNSIIGSGKKIHRYSFESLEFQLEDEIEEDIA